MNGVVNFYCFKINFYLKLSYKVVQNNNILKRYFRVRGAGRRKFTRIKIKGVI